MVEYNRVDNLDRIYADANAVCERGTTYNLVLAYEFVPALADSRFVKLHETKAADWQSEQPPRHLHFTHGQYFRGETGIGHVIRELKAKSNSRRALLSLVGMDDVLGSGDRAIPSFMIAQFGLADGTLYVTAYFRALEVANFLPINLAEISLLIRRISGEIGIGVVRLLIIAFQAYRNPEFHCLQKALLDQQKRGAVGAAVAKHEVKALLSWLEGKRQYESEIVTEGLEEMVNAADECAALYPPNFVFELRKALDSLRRMKESRVTSSAGAATDDHHAEYLRHLQEAMRALGGA